VRETWSFWEDAVDSIGKGDLETGRAAVDPDVALMEEWLTKSFNDRDMRSSAWLFFFAIACMIALFGALNSAPVITAVMVVALGVAATGYIYEKSFYRRLVKRVRRGKPAPQVFTGGNGDATRNYISSMFSTPRTMFDKDGKPARFSHEPSALDLVWLTSINEALPLKQALCGRSQFPVAISRLEREIVVVSLQQPEPESLQSITYNVTHETYVDQRQVHLYTNAAKAGQQNGSAEEPVKAPSDNTDPSVDPHWLGPISETEFSKLFVEFERHLPDALKWMALIVEQAKPIVDRHLDWTDLKLLNETLVQVQKTKEWKLLRKPPQPDTVEKLLYRDRSNSYSWVREFFTRVGAPHKYDKSGQISLGI
jgi:hypothetical protein